MAAMGDDVPADWRGHVKALEVANLRPCVQALLSCFSKIARHPTERKWRNINTKHDGFRRKIGRNASAMAILCAGGFDAARIPVDATADVVADKYKACAAGTDALYLDKRAGALLPCTVVKLHFDSGEPPYATVAIHSGAEGDPPREKQTDFERLRVKSIELPIAAPDTVEERERQSLIREIVSVLGLAVERLAPGGGGGASGTGTGTGAGAGAGAGTGAGSNGRRRGRGSGAL